jgi:hypothetical protein
MQQESSRGHTNERNRRPFVLPSRNATTVNRAGTLTAWPMIWDQQLVFDQPVAQKKPMASRQTCKHAQRNQADRDTPAKSQPITGTESQDTSTNGWCHGCVGSSVGIPGSW